MSEADLAKRKKEKRQEAGRFLQLLVVVGSFLFGYLPRTGSIFLNIFSLPKYFKNHFQGVVGCLQYDFRLLSLLTRILAATEPQAQQHEF